MTRPEIMQSTFSMPDAAKAALATRRARFESHYATYCELDIGHCAVQGAVSDSDPEMTFNYFIGQRVEPGHRQINYMLIGLYKLPEFTRSESYMRARTGRTGDVSGMTSGILRACENKNSYRAKEALPKLQLSWRDMLVNDLIAGGGTAPSKHDLLSETNRVMVMDAVETYLQRFEDDRGEIPSFVAARAWGRRALQAV